jgi:hypothetical protein
VASPRPARLSSARILRDLRAAARKGDRAALTLALDQMRTLALSPRYWEKYLVLLRNPLARLVDLLVIKQGERIAHQKGWKRLGGGLRPPSEATPPARSRGRRPRSKRRPRPRRRRPTAAPEQPLLFEL